MSQDTRTVSREIPAADRRTVPPRDPPAPDGPASMVASMSVDNADRPVGRVLRPTHRAFVEGFVHPGDPVIVEGALERWPALGTWTPGHFASRWGRLEVRVDGEVFTMAEFVSRVRDPEDTAPYIRAYDVGDLAPGLLADLQPELRLMQPNWLDGRFVPRRFSFRDELRSGTRWELLFGEPGSTFPVLHWDLNHYHAFIAQLHGEKSVVMYPPDQSDRLYPREDFPNQSRIPVGRDFDPGRFPRFREARGACATLRPGDLLFIPGGWWHAVENTSVSIAVTANTANRSNWSRVVHHLTAGRGSSVRQRAVAGYLHGVGFLRRVLEG